jgi:hypothetical protein
VGWRPVLSQPISDETRHAVARARHTPQIVMLSTGAAMAGKRSTKVFGFVSDRATEWFCHPSRRSDLAGQTAVSL